MMEKAEIIQKLTDIISAYITDKSQLTEITESTDFIKDLKINSANLVDITLDIEEAFGIEIDNASMEQMLSVGAAMTIISEKIAAK